MKSKESNYIRLFKRELCLPCRQKNEILRDLRESFSSAEENGEEAKSVVERLGPPAELAQSIAEQLGIDLAARKRRNRAIIFACLSVLSAIFFILYAISYTHRIPEDAIGFAEASTQIALENAFDISPVFFWIGCIFLFLAIVCLCWLFKMSRRRILR